ncbi:proline dehydrogenase 1, mitochondrial [Lingula anatina]|uniref:Proline dehydrogenase n=1 Tax=Lingula anatina TaxID=7574 RepID=A0A1S3KEW9_LINAN|nr:proline dehydrogenase 1, mitochondrial [Lingula anatina]|eukprot:XP_013420786.1 proline dehydrogenase 1, mitochondrial [Lingula anatina]
MSARRMFSRLKLNSVSSLNSLGKRSLTWPKQTVRHRSSVAANVRQEKDAQVTQETDRDEPYEKLDLTFENATEAYKSKKTSEVLRALFVFNLCSVRWLVEHNKEVMKWSRKLMGKTLFEKVMKATFYGHFVAGEDNEAIKPIIRRQAQYGVKSILDYGVEKDISSEQAKKAEMASCVPAAEDGQSVAEGSDARFRAHQEFGDRREDVVSARTYFYEDEAQCDENMEIFKTCIDAVSGATGSTGFAAIKLTALGRPQLLLQLSELLVQMSNLFDQMTGQEKDVALRRIRQDALEKNLKDLGIPISRDSSHEWFTWLDVSGSREVDLFEWSNFVNITKKDISKKLVVPNIETGELNPLLPELTPEEKIQVTNMLDRINELVEHAVKKDVRLMIDAEQSYFQPAISRLTMEMMRKFNKQKAFVFNTYQCYLKSAHNNLVIDMDLAKREDFYFGAKLVRGAYMDQERKRAETIGYEDPINPSYEATTTMYHKCLDHVLEEVHQREMGRIAVMVASHNEDTVRETVQSMKDHGIKASDRIICFGQLFGMCDQVSFPLGQAGYSVYKYVPFGPVEDVMPYLSRRAYENSGMLTKVKKEKRLLWQELKRRVMSGKIMHDPLKAEQKA